MLVRTMVVVLAMVGVARAEDEVFKCKPEATASPAAADDKWPLFAKLVPATRGCLDGEVVAVMAAYKGRVQAATAGGGAYELERDREREPAFELTVGPNAVRVPHLPAPDEPNDIIATDGAGQQLLARSRQIHLSEGPKHKLTADAHLVRIRINAGRGSAAREFDFHAEVLEVLDGTKAYPLRVSRALHATLEPFASNRRVQGKRWRQRLRKITGDAVKADKAANLASYPRRGEDVEGAYYATWLPESKTLRVVFYGRLTKWHRRPLPVEAGAKKRRIEVRSYPAEYAYEVEFGVDGKRVAAKEHLAPALPPTTQTESVF
jgi:hypothetical protein